MKVMMRVDVIEREAGVLERLELGADLGGDLAARAGVAKDANAGADHISRESAIAADEVGNSLRRQHGNAIDQHEMKPDTQIGHAPGACYRVRRGLACDHQAGGGQNAAAMPCFDSLVDAGFETEIIRCDDKPFQGLPLKAADVSLAVS
jgi:hypothetical protein